MKLRLPWLIVFTLIRMSVLSQCIGREKIVFGGDYNFVDYIFHCPTYSFAINGDTSKNWNILNDPIELKQAPAKALKYRRFVEVAIKKYSGAAFFADLKFIDVEVVFPDKFSAFSGRSDVSQRYCKARYFYHYQFTPDTIAKYLIGIAVDDRGKIISPFTFPSRKYYRPVDKSFTYCKLIEIARKNQSKIDPIEDIKLDYDKKDKKFYWLISQAIVNVHEGRNDVNLVYIDASDLSKVKTVKSYALIIF